MVILKKNEASLPTTGKAASEIARRKKARRAAKTKARAATKVKARATARTTALSENRCSFCRGFPGGGPSEASDEEGDDELPLEDTNPMALSEDDLEAPLGSIAEFRGVGDESAHAVFPEFVRSVAADGAPDDDGTAARAGLW